jgi:diguanylate cyclase (GGDEF)-like protein
MSFNDAKQLQPGDQHFRELLDHLAQAAFVIAPDGRVIYANPAAARFFSTDLAGLLDKPFPHPVSQGTSDLVVRCPDGSSFPASMWATATVWEANPVHLVTITETSRQVKEPSLFQDNNERIQRWMKELEQRNRDAVLMNDFIDDLQDCRKPGEMFVVVGKYTPRLFEGLSGAIYLFNPASSALEYTASWGDNPPAETIIPIQSCPAYQKKAQVAMLTNLPTPICQNIPLEKNSFHLCSPMLSQKEVVGMLHLYSPAGHTGGDILSMEHLKQKAHIFSEQVGLTLANLRLRENLDSSALHDSSTGLFNRRYIDDLVERELRRAIRHQRSMVVIMVELENYAILQSSYGQAAANAVVKATAEYLHSQVRREDLACRLGEQQFVLVLPEATLVDVTRRAEVIRTGAKAIRMQVQNVSIKPVVVSLGISAYPEHGSSVRDLLLAAGKALHGALESGGDRVLLAPRSAPFAEKPSSG